MFIFCWARSIERTTIEKKFIGICQTMISFFLDFLSRNLRYNKVISAREIQLRPPPPPIFVNMNSKQIPFLLFPFTYILLPLTFSTLPTLLYSELVRFCRHPWCTWTSIDAAADAPFPSSPSFPCSPCHAPGLWLLCLVWRDTKQDCQRTMTQV